MTTSANTPAPVCTATERITNALYEITLQRGQGIFDLGRLAGVLKGEIECDGHPVPTVPNRYAASPYRPPFIGHGIPG